MGRLASPLALALLLAGAAVALAAEGDRPPVALHQTPILTPIEAAGSGLSPEVKLRAAIDVRGRVASVEVLAVEPPSAFDEVFRQTAIDTVSEWRYAPAVVDGVAAPTTLAWTLKFVPREEGTATAFAGHRLFASYLGAHGAGDPEAERARVLALPLELRKQLLAAQVTKAERQLTAGRRHRAESARFVVVSDAEDATTADVVARNLESIFNLLGSLFQPHFEPQPEGLKVVAYVFARQSSYDALRRDIGHIPEFAAGFYHGAGFLAFHLEVPTSDHLMNVLVHEACHAYVDRHLARTDRPFPLWLAEGFANYLGNSEVKKGELRLGSNLKSRFVMCPNYQGVFRLTTEAGWDLATVQKSIRAGTRLTLDQLLDADRAVFAGEKRWLFYPTAWMLVHFLRHGAPEWAEREFPTFLLYVAEGYSAGEALEAVYGRSRADLESALLAYARRL